MSQKFLGQVCLNPKFFGSTLHPARTTLLYAQRKRETRLCDKQAFENAKFNLLIQTIMKTKKLTFEDLDEICRKHNKKNGIETQFDDENALKCRIVFKNQGANKGSSLEERTYEFRSDNKYFLSGNNGNSIYATNLTKTDRNIRLDWYLYSPKWPEEYCYLA